MKRLSEPRELGRYRLVAELGRGAMGIVFLGVATNGNLVALKRIREQFLDDDEFRARFRREVDSSKKVSSPRTAGVIDADVDADPPWLASEFVHGPTLEASIDEVGPLPEASVLRLAEGLVLALSDIHRTGLIHRDLKPSNVILAKDGPRVIDFGIARAAETEGGTDITHTSWLLGSPGYMSPEQAESGTLTTASDMFSMATVLYVASTGSNPFKGTGSPQTMYNVVHSSPDLDVLPASVRAIVEPCWSKDPGDRPTAEQLRDVIPVANEPRTWPAALNTLAEQQRAAVTELLPDDTVRFHDGGTKVFGDEPGASTTGGPDPKDAAPPPSPPPVRPPTAPSQPWPKSPATIGWAVVAGLIVIILSAGVIDELDGGTDDTGTNGADQTTADATTGSDIPTYGDDETDYVDDDPEPTQDDIVGVGVGDCVWGSSEVGADWDVVTCQDGNFTVIERIEGATDYNACDDSDHRLDYGQHITDFGGGDTDFVMCLSVNWAQGDIGHAPVDTCLSRSGSGKNMYFEFVDCASANAIVTGRTPTYNDPGFCNQHGWATDRIDEFDISYTVCWQDY